MEIASGIDSHKLPPNIKSELSAETIRENCHFPDVELPVQNGLFDPLQSAYRPNNSTETALIRIFDDF